MTKRKRVLKSTDRIYEALCTLINENKPYDAISIQNIVDKAQVCRNSFYRNYTCKDDIFRKQFEVLCEQSDLYYQQHNDGSFESIVRAIFEASKAQGNFLKCFYQANPKVYFEVFTKKIIQSNTPIPLDKINPTDYYLYASKAWLATGLLTEWMLKDFNEDTATLSKQVADWVTNGLK
ncbi:MAG: TetR/AcrR family transcriptional regulator [Erysipelotrichaceae bacterium]|nr:TetR/AcrR family transcriptional regulator [Erysipelotrichaceae bacterium]